MKVIMNDEVFRKKGYHISTDPALLDVDFIFHFLNQESYWAQGISREIIERSIAESLCFGVYHDEKQIGFARIITDKSTFAYLSDVFISKTYRKQGLAKWLLQSMMAYPDLQNLRRWMLATADAHTLYEKFGFTQLNSPNRWMQKFTPYQKQD